MKDRCFATEELAAILNLPTDSPERRHIDRCPRCRALMLTYREFLEDRSIPDAADADDAEVRLHGAFRDALAAAPQVERGAAIHPSSGSAPSRWIQNLFWGIGRAPVLVPAAAALLVAVGLWAGIGYIREMTGPDRLRGPAAPERGAAGDSILLLEPLPHGAEGIELRWHSLPGVTAYEITVFAADLSDLARFGSLADTTCVVNRTDLHPLQPPGTVVGWQVVALQGGAPIARSPIGTARIR